MARGEINPINRVVPLTEIEKRIRDLEKNGRVLKSPNNFIDNGFLLDTKTG